MESSTGYPVHLERAHGKEGDKRRSTFLVRGVFLFIRWKNSYSGEVVDKFCGVLSFRLHDWSPLLFYGRYCPVSDYQARTLIYYVLWFINYIVKLGTVCKYCLTNTHLLYFRLNFTPLRKTIRVKKNHVMSLNRAVVWMPETSAP